jgi:WD40 repeat protein
LFTGGPSSSILSTNDWAIQRTFAGHYGNGLLGAISPDGTLAATVAGDNALRVWRTRDGVEVARTSFSLQLASAGTLYSSVLAFAPDGSSVAAIDGGDTLRLFETSTLGLRWATPSGQGTIHSVLFVPDGGTVLAGVAGEFLRFDPASGKQVGTPITTPAAVGVGALSGDGLVLATVVPTFSGGVQFYRVADGSPSGIGSVTGVSAFQGAIALSHDGSLLAVGTSTDARIFSTTDGSLLKTLDTGGSLTVALSPDDVYLAAGLHALSIWRVSDGGKVYDGGQFTVTVPTAQSPVASALAVAEDTNDAFVWDPEQGTLLRTLVGSSQAETVTYDPSGHLLVDTGAVGISWDLTMTAPVRTLNYVVTTQPPDWSSSLIFTPDGASLIGGGDSADPGGIRIWSAADGSLRGTLTAHAAGLTAFAIDPSGQLLATAGFDAAAPSAVEPPGGVAIKLWSFPAGTLQNTLVGDTDRVLSLAFSPDGASLLSGDNAGLVRLWSVANGTSVRDLSPASDPNGFSIQYGRSVAYSPDGRWVASSGLDLTVTGGFSGAVEIWSASDGSVIRHLLSPADSNMGPISWSSDGRVIAAAAAAGIRVWCIDGL